MVELAEQLTNISEACRKLGVSRRHFYYINGALEEEGIEGLLEKVQMFYNFKSLVKFIDILSF